MLISDDGYNYMARHFLEATRGRDGFCGPNVVTAALLHWTLSGRLHQGRCRPVQRQWQAGQDVVLSVKSTVEQEDHEARDHKCDKCSG